MRTTLSRSALFALVVAGAVVAGAGAGLAACGGGNRDDTSSGDQDSGSGDTSNGDGVGVGDGVGFDIHDGGGGDGVDSPTGFDGAPPVDASFPCDGCTPFPTGAPPCDPATLAAPTIVYPPDGVLLPPNMNVLEVQWLPSPGATMYDVEFSNAVTSVRVETPCVSVPDVRGAASRGCGLTLPLKAWIDIADENRDGDPVHVVVRSTKGGGCVATSATKVDVSFAKEDLAGGIYYWQSATFGGIGGKTGGIYYHDFGTFDPTPTPFYTSGASGTCVGCHTLSRDGARMALLTDDPDADDEFGDVHSHVLDVATRTVLGGAAISPGFQSFTHDHSQLVASTYKTHKNLAFDVFSGDGTTLIKSNPLTVEGTQPDLSKDDKHLVFVVPGPLPGAAATSISKAGDHHFLAGSLYTASYDVASSTVGAPSEILASTGTENYYYPSFSPDGAFLVLDDATTNESFYNRVARVKLLHFPPSAGAKPLDLPSLNLTGSLTNSWPKWSPFVQTYKGKHILWLTFSSNRDYGLHLLNVGKNPDGTTIDNCYPPNGPTDPAYDDLPQPLSKAGVTYGDCAQPQIWMAAIVVDPDPSLDSGDRSFPAFWLPFQDVNSHNHSAQWVEKIVVPPPPGGDAGTDAPEAGTCVPAGGGCSAALCCTDVVCCGGTCLSTCIR